MIFRGLAKRGIAWILASTSVAALLIGAAPEADAAQSIAAVQAQVTSLQIQASAIAEQAQQSQVDLIALQRSLNSIQAQDSVQTSSLTALKKSIGILASEQYKNGFLGQGMTLMFSSDPTQYLNSAQSLSVVEAQNAVRMRKVRRSGYRPQKHRSYVESEGGSGRSGQGEVSSPGGCRPGQIGTGTKIIGRTHQGRANRLAALASLTRQRLSKALAWPWQRERSPRLEPKQSHFDTRSDNWLTLYVWWRRSGLLGLFRSYHASSAAGRNFCPSLRISTNGLWQANSTQPDSTR